jgi:transcriptional regulator of arginine metabolism
LARARRSPPAPRPLPRWPTRPSATNAIRELVETRVVGSQEELRKLLRQRGWDVTQSTLSRDLREMRLARVPTDDGARYVVTGGEPDTGRMTLETLLPQLFDRIDGVGELLVLHTLPGGAQALAFALDAEQWPDLLGTIAGDDTILLICRSAQARDRIARRVRALADVEV